MEEMRSEGMATGEINDNISSGSSINSSYMSIGENSRSSTPLSDSSNDPSYDPGENSDTEDVGAYFYYEM